MKDKLRYTLVTDGSSDVVLIPILTWVLIENGIRCVIRAEWADLRRLPIRGKLRLHDRIRLSLKYYPCDLLFVHRDAEREPPDSRKREILKAVGKTGDSLSGRPAVCVVPVRMQEAWLLFDEKAIRFAAGNRSGRQPLSLPRMSRVEKIPDPKALLHECLRRASGLQGRRLRRFRANQSALRIAENIDDFSPLRALSAFDALENDLKEIIAQQGWVCL